MPVIRYLGNVLTVKENISCYFSLSNKLKMMLYKLFYKIHKILHELNLLEMNFCAILLLTHVRKHIAVCDKSKHIAVCDKLWSNCV